MICTDHTDVERMAEVVLGARLVVSAAGSTTWELLALGIPVLSVAVSENQRPIAEAASRRGAVVDAGFGASAETVVTCALQLLDDVEALRSLARQGRTVVDGRGVWRLLDRVVDSLDKPGAR